ncbi:hypothetical protein CsatB_022745 [Cannabis sativa]
MATTRSGSKSPSPAKKVSKKSKKAPTVTSKVEPKMGLKKIAKNLVADVPETSGTKKRAPPVKVDAPKTKRAKISKSARDVSSDSDFEDEVHGEDQKPKVESKVHARTSVKVEGFDLPKKNPPKEWDYIYDQKNLFIAKAFSTATFQVIENIKSCLSDVQLEMFSKTCFGHFLNLPDFKVQPQVFHGLLLREVQQPNDAELWVMIRGVRLRFSIEEFALITGLDCEGDCSVLDFKQEVNSLCERYWPTSSSITKESVRECFTTKRWGDSDEDAVKLVVLYFVEWFLLSGTKHKNVPKSILDVVDSGRYNEFAWGRSSFELTISSWKGKLDSWVEGVRKARSSGKRPSVFYTLIGCPHVLQVWFYECCKYMKGKYCQKESSRIPRITQWTCNSQPTFKVLKTTIFDVSKDKLQLSNMRPTAGEFKALKLSSFKFDTDYNSYKSLPLPEEPTVAQSDISVKLDAFSEKFHGLEVKIDLLHTSQQKISSDLVELKEFVSAQFVSFGAQMASMQTQFSTVFADSYAKEKGSDSSNDDDGGGDEADFDLNESEETDENEEENVMGDEEGEGSEGEEKDGQADEDSDSKEKNDNGSDDESTDSEEKNFVDFNDGPTQIDVEATVQSGVKAVEIMMSSDGIGGDPCKQISVSENVEVTDRRLVCFEMGATGLNVDSNIELEDDPIPVEETPLVDKRKSKKPIALTSPFMEYDSSISSSKDGSGYGVVKYVAGLCPLDDKIGEDVEHKDEIDFDLWLGEGRRSKKDPHDKEKVYLKGKDKIVPPFRFGVEDVATKMWFHKLAYTGQCLTNSHLDIIFYYLRKKGKYAKEPKVKFTTTDCLFFKTIHVLYEKFIAQKKNLSLITAQHAIADYIRGRKMLCGSPWHLCDHVFFIIHMETESHWILGRLNIEERRVYMYNSLSTAMKDSAAIKACQPFAVLLPHFFALFDEFKKENKPVCLDPFEVVKVDGLPQQTSNDCGCFVASFAEYFIDMKPIPPIFDVEKHRDRLAVLFYKYARMKEVEFIDSEDEAPLKGPKKNLS